MQVRELIYLPVTIVVVVVCWSFQNIFRDKSSFGHAFGFILDMRVSNQFKHH